MIFRVIVELLFVSLSLFHSLIFEFVSLNQRIVFFSISFSNFCAIVGAKNLNLFEGKMSALPSLTKEPTYQKLQEWFNANGNNLNIKSLFESDPARFDKYR